MNNDLDSNPQPPTGEPQVAAMAPTAAGRDEQQAASALDEALHVLSEEFGDAAPASSRTRAARLLQDEPPWRALALLAEARSRTEGRMRAISTQRKDGTVNAMPYLLATLEDLLAAADHLEPRSVPARLLPTPAKRAESTTALPAPDPHLPPLWIELLADLRHTVSGAVIEQRLARLAVEQVGEQALRILAPNAFAAQWLERVMRARLERSLAELGHDSVQMEILVRGVDEV
jgi:hypothetical protein